MPKIKLKCRECGRVTECWPSQQRQFCSMSCRSKWRARSDSPPQKPRTGRYEPCETCGTPVWRMQFQIKKGIGRFCSKECHDKSQTKEHQHFICETCGNDFALKPSQAVHQAGRFCSKPCEGLSRIKRPLEREYNGKPARVDGHGYVWVWEPEHPSAAKYKGWVAEHRMVAEQILGRPLTSEDEVHHINRDRSDNRPENLDVLDGESHAHVTAQQRESDRLLLARYIEKYGPLN